MFVSKHVILKNLHIHLNMKSVINLFTDCIQYFKLIGHLLGFTLTKIHALDAHVHIMSEFFLLNLNQFKDL